MIRYFEKNDMPDIYRICILTGNAGKDASGLFENHDLLGDMYCAPYVAFAPEFCVVGEDDIRGVCGYCLGVGDSKKFAEFFCEQWVAMMKQKYAYLAEDTKRYDYTNMIESTIFSKSIFSKSISSKEFSKSKATSDVAQQDQKIYKSIVEFSYPYSDEFLMEYPAHLHINLLSIAQGQGWGRQLLQKLLDLFERSGSKGVHLGVDEKNVGAIAFYKKFGFEQVRDKNSVAKIKSGVVPDIPFTMTLRL